MPLPGVFPPGAPAPTSSRAEQAFHRALTASLPPGWFAWHSRRIRTAENYEGEGDFVLAIPGRGVLVIEVKGGSIEKRGGLWLQNGRAMDRAPREQAHEYRQKLQHKLRERCPGEIPWIAIATSFPDKRARRAHRGASLIEASKPPWSSTRRAVVAIPLSARRVRSPDAGGRAGAPGSSALRS